ncbi:hypothetical protein G5I_04455 [Acromyrmex echinatior]|uniref:Uncharacterized protein n=1 Tax=Acromyrmex echinatior TaxID=103372 RepID=F4WFP6_ACREC|nr:hypothetical protein G5I_04455 [Acromyrmex echinatior]
MKLSDLSDYFPPENVLKGGRRGGGGERKGVTKGVRQNEKGVIGSVNALPVIVTGWENAADAYSAAAGAPAVAAESWNATFLSGFDMQIA